MEFRNCGTSEVSTDIAPASSVPSRCMEQRRDRRYSARHYWLAAQFGVSVAPWPTF
jgi:hypothetical protein